MALDKLKLELLSGGGAGLRLLGYKTDEDILADIDTVGYFNEASTQLREGDLIFVKASDGMAIAPVATILSNQVDLYNFTILSSSNTD